MRRSEVRKEGEFFVVDHNEIPEFIESFHEFAADGMADKTGVSEDKKLGQVGWAMFGVEGEEAYIPALKGVDSLTLVYQEEQ